MWNCSGESPCELSCCVDYPQRRGRLERDLGRRNGHRRPGFRVGFQALSIVFALVVLAGHCSGVLQVGDHIPEVMSVQHVYLTF